MENSVSKGRSAATTVIVALAVTQGIFGALRALAWIQVGSDLMTQGALLLPIVGVVASLRAGSVAVIALLYVVFAFALYAGRTWARPIGLTAAAANLLLAASVLIQGEFLARDLVLVIVPVMVVWHCIWSGRGEPTKPKEDVR